MARLGSQLTHSWNKLTRFEKFFVLLALLMGINWMVQRISSLVLPFAGFINYTFAILAFALLIKYFLRLMRRFVWRIRNRLIVAYIFIGVVPVLLIFAMLTIGLYVLMGQVATYLLTRELQNRYETVRDCASILVWQTAEHYNGEDVEQVATQTLLHLQCRVPTLQAIVRIDDSTFKLLGRAVRESYPSWSWPGFMGLVRVGREYVLAAHSEARMKSHSIDVFAYEPVDLDLLSSLLPELATVNLLELGILPEEKSEGQESPEHDSDHGDVGSLEKRPNYGIRMNRQLILPS